MKKLNSISAIVGLSLLSQTALAKSTINVDSMLQNADMVIQGKIVDIQYKDSDEGLPHTFVTYQIDNLIAGNNSAKEVTLRFIGGEQREGDVVRHLSVSEVPEFNKGESDVLFIRKNNTVICPLVKCSQGRFRDLNGLVTNSKGQPVLLNSQSKLELGKEIMTEHLHSNSEHRQFGKSFSNHSGEVKTQQTQRNSSHLDTQTFVAEIKQRVLTLKHSGKIKTKNLFKSSNPKESFSTPFFKPVKPIDSQPTLSAKSIRSSKSQSKFDQWEEQMLKSNGGEPVIEVPKHLKQVK